VAADLRIALSARSAALPTGGVGRPGPLGRAAAGTGRNLVEAFFDPARLEASLDVATIGDVERFLGLPVRRELAHALAGHAVVALIEEPVAGAPGSILALFDLAHAEAARALVERTLALGVLSGKSASSVIAT